MVIEFRISLRIWRRRPPVEDEPEMRDSAVDALVERGEDLHSPELHEYYREPPWDHRRRMGFRPSE